MRRDIPAQHIKSVGFELEGGIDGPGLKQLQGYVRENRLSVYYNDKQRERSLNVKGKDHPNMEIRFWNGTLKVCTDFIEHAYRCGFETDQSCGFHVHLAFDDMTKAVSTFSSPTVIKQFVDSYKDQFDDHRYLSRLKNVFCSNPKNVDIASNGAVLFEKKTIINIGAYLNHGTIEFRLLPNQQNAIEAISSLEWLVKESDRIFAENLGASDAMLSHESVRSIFQRHKERKVALSREVRRL
ncbi:MAG: hypothetical protein KGH62_04685 [Candidatus Micrarchaeota archaeon]|nr:hypothetical protein [Candidatus Micrarchaeota archaeon]